MTVDKVPAGHTEDTTLDPESGDASETWLRVFADHAPVMIWLTDADGYNRYLNRAWLRFRGRAHDQEVVAGWRDGLHPEDRDRVVAVWRAAFEARKPYDAEYRLRRADGRYRWVMSSARAMVDPAGLFQGYAGITIDITERRAADQSLAEGRTYYRSLFKDSPIAQWYEDWSSVKVRLAEEAVHDQGGLDSALAHSPSCLAWLEQGVRLLDANDAALELDTLVDRPELAGALAGRPHGGSLAGPAQFEAVLRGLLDGREWVTWEGARRRVDGSSIAVRTASTVPASSRDDWTRVLHVLEDRTGQREAEAEARRSNDILHAIGFAATRFLGAVDWHDEIVAVLGTLGEAAGVSRVYIFEHFEGARGLAMRQIHEWAAPGVRSELDRECYRDLPIAGSGYEPWFETFESGQVLTALTRDLPERLRGELREQDILSIASVPIRVGGAMWGHVGFDQCDRERIWMPAEIEALTMAAGLIGAAIERSVAKASAKHSHDLLRAIVDAVPAMVNAKDAAGRYILMNRYQADLYGTTTDDAVGRTAAELLGPAYGAETGTLDRQVLETGRAVEDYEQTYADAHGAVRTWFSTKAPLRDASGRIANVVTVAHDITERKQAEDRLRDALAVAEFANRSKSEFIANISHELRTPLNAIIGFSEVMLGGTQGAIADQRHADYLQGILESGRHLLEIVNDLLDLARLDAGRLSMVEGPMRLDRVIQGSMRLVRDRAAEAGLSLVIEPSEALPAVWGDERRIKQILINLLTNAIKFTPSGGTVRLSARLAENGDMALAVADSGIGMSADDVIIAMKPFGQVDRALSRSHGGVGLGLPLCKAMAEMHQGSLDIVSERDQGTTIIVRLPKARVIATGARGLRDRATDLAAIKAGR